MQMCQDHWKMLRTAIDERGLSHMVSADSEEAFQKELKHITGVPTTPLEAYDPLMSAYWAIMRNSLEALGPIAMNLLSASHPAECPLCYMNELCQCPEDNCANKWITFAADGQKVIYEEKRKQEEERGD